MGLEGKPRPGGELEGKSVQGPDGKWYNQFGEKVDDPTPTAEGQKRPGGQLEGRPVQGPDGKWRNQFGEEVSEPSESNEN